MGGNYYTGERTAAGTALEIGLGLTPFQVLTDARDIIYDMQHWDEIPRWQKIADMSALRSLFNEVKIFSKILDATKSGKKILKVADDAMLAVVGGLVYLVKLAGEEVGNLFKKAGGVAEAAADAAQYGDEIVDAVADAGKHGDEIVDAAADTGENADELLQAIEENLATGKYTDEAADILKHSDDLADAGAAMGKNADELVDAGKNGVYNRIRQAGNIERKPDDLMEELAASGVKYTKEDVILVTRNSDGDLLWLETGNDSAGLTHILQRHESQFKDIGISTEEISQVLQEILQTEPVKTTNNKIGPSKIYTYNGQDYLVAYGTNGYIVSFYPYTVR